MKHESYQNSLKMIQIIGNSHRILFSIKDIEFIVKNLETKKNPNLNVFIYKIYQTFTKEILILHKLFQKFEEYGIFVRPKNNLKK